MVPRICTITLYKALQALSYLLWTWCLHGCCCFPTENIHAFALYVGSDASLGSLSIIPDIKAEYVEVKGMFVDICTAQGTPTLDEVKGHCLDLIECVFCNIPRTSYHKGDIAEARTMRELARVVCFRLSKWVSFDFFKKVVAHFQPTLRVVKERLTHYEDQLKHLLQLKLEYIAELQRR